MYVSDRKIHIPFDSGSFATSSVRIRELRRTRQKKKKNSCPEQLLTVNATNSQGWVYSVHGERKKRYHL